MSTTKSYLELVVADVMATDPVTAGPGATADALEEEMERSDVRHLPVLDGTRIVGIVSDRDLHWATKSSTAADIMSDDVLSVSAETRLCEASAIMLEKKISALPVLGDDGGLVGIITDTDFLRIAHEVCGGSQLSVEDD